MRNLIVGLGIIGLMSVGASAQGRHWGHRGNWNGYNNGSYNNHNVNFAPPVNGSYNWANGNPYQNGYNGNYNYNYNYNNNGYNNGYYNNGYYNNGYYNNNGYYRRNNNAGQIINGLLNRRW